MPSRRGQVARYKRRQQVLTLFTAGKEPDEIAVLINEEVDKTGGSRTSVNAVRGIIDRQLERWSRDAPAEQQDRARALALERLDHMTAALWPKVKAGNPRAIEAALKIEERRSRVMGIDAATKHEHEHDHHHEHTLTIDRDEVDRLHQAFVDSSAEELPAAPADAVIADDVDARLLEASSAA